MGITVHEKAPDAESLLLTDAVGAGRGGSRRSGRCARDRRFRIRPHDRSGAHVHARDGHGRAADSRRRDPHRQAHRGRPRPGAQRPRHYPPTYDYLLAAFEPVKAGQGRIDRPHRRLPRPECARRDRAAAQPEDGRAQRKRPRPRTRRTEKARTTRKRRSTPARIRWRPRKRFAAIAQPAQHRSPRASTTSAQRPRPEGRARAQAPRRRSSWNSSSRRRCSTRWSGTCAATWTRCAASSARSWRSACARPACRARTSSSTFPKNETNVRWIDKHVRAKRKHSAPLGRLREEVERRQQSCARSRSA